MKAYVTGGLGFIGSHMIRLLRDQGHEAISFDIKHSPFQDVRTVTNYFSHQNVDWIFHFAGIPDLIQSIASPAVYFDHNAQGTARVLEAARHAGVKKIVYAASSSCYGAFPAMPVKESGNIDCAHPYAFSKYAGEEACIHWHQVYGLPVNSLRIFNAYGRGQRSSNYGAVFSVFMRQKLAGKPLTIVGDGKQMRDFVHVTDVCKAFLAAAETPLSGKIWNVGSGNAVSVNQIATMIGGETVHIPVRPGEPYRIRADRSKILRDLGWSPSVSLRDGIDDMLLSIDDWQDAPLWTPESIAVQTTTWMRELGC